MYGFPIDGSRTGDAYQTHNCRKNDFFGNGYVSRPIDYSSTNIFDLEKSAHEKFSYIDDFGFI